MTRCSSGKRRFDSKELAKRWLRRLQTVPRQIKLGWDEPTASITCRRVYRCTLEGCGGWHLTSQKLRPPREVAA